MSSNVEKIHAASMKILERTGMRFLHPDALSILKENGIRVEGDTAYFTEEELMKWVKLAPAEARLYAEDSDYDMTLGGDRRYRGPCGGSTFIMDRDGNKRDALLEDFIRLTKLFEGNPAFHLAGGLACQPQDVPTVHTIELLALATMLHTRKCLFMASGDYATMESLVKLVCARYDLSVEELKERPRFCTIANTNTALMLDKTMTETIITMARYRQPCIIASAAMAGTTSPVTLAGTIAIVNAEVLASIALAQMVSPGTPVIYGSQSTNADMATCAIAIGSPEGALCYKYCAQMAKFYGLPCRGGGSLTDAKALDAQAGYESMLVCMASQENGINIMTQSAGIMESYLSVSYEKLMVDFEIIDFVDRYLRDIEVDEDTVPLDLIHELGHGGQYLLEDHTLEFCREELQMPRISVRGPREEPAAQLQRNIDQRMERLLESYRKPEVSAETLDALRTLFRERGVEDKHIDMAMGL